MSDSQYIFHATDESFEAEVLHHSGAVLVDFWAEWCGPCRAIAPVLEGLAEEYTNKIKIVKVNVDESPNSPQQFKVRGIPTLIFFKNGKVVDQLVGNHPKESIKDMIQKTIN